MMIKPAERTLLPQNVSYCAFLVLDFFNVLSRNFLRSSHHNFIPYPACVGKGKHKIFIQTHMSCLTRIKNLTVMTSFMVEANGENSMGISF